jgi:Cellulose biosynthesis protein BcsN
MKNFALVAVLIGVAPLAAGCSAVSGDFPSPYARTTTAEATSTSRTPYEAWAFLPVAGGEALSVSEETTPNRRSQRISFGGVGVLAGENMITVAIAGSRSTDPALLHPPREEDIAAEMARVLPDVPMTRTSAIETNGYGPFGYARGSAGSISCIYAWQWVESDGLSLKKNPVSIRMRFCGNDSDDRLVGLMRGLRLTVGASPPMASPLFAPGTGRDALDVAATGYSAL